MLLADTSIWRIVLDTSLVTGHISYLFILARTAKPALGLAYMYLGLHRLREDCIASVCGAK